MKSLKFFKPTLATTLAIGTGAGYSSRPARPSRLHRNAAASGHDVRRDRKWAHRLARTDFFYSSFASSSGNSWFPSTWLEQYGMQHKHWGLFFHTGSTTDVDSYVGASGPMSFGRADEMICQQWRRQHGRDSRGSRGTPIRIYRSPSQCSKGLCLR